MTVLRIALVAVLSLAAGSTSGQRVTTEGPPLYVAERKDAKVYILGIAIPRDTNRTWLSAAIRSAVEQSADMWGENPAGAPTRDAALVRRLGQRTTGTLFDGLNAADVNRVLKVAESLRLEKATLDSLMPWAATGAFQRAFFARAATPPPRETPEDVLREMLVKAGKPYHPEFANWDDFPKFFAALPEKTQYQYLFYNLDFIEAGSYGEDEMSAEWSVGRVESWERYLERMRIRYPELYTAFNVTRNGEWVDRIDTMLDKGGVHFIVCGINHTLGPDSIQRQLERRGIAVRRV